MQASSIRWALAVSGCALIGCAATAADIGTAFTYQGRLVKDGTPVTSPPPHCDFAFGLWDAPAGGNQKGNSPQALTGVLVTEGLFPVTLDFGAAGIDGTARWLEISVQCPGDAVATTLAPRQELKPAPHALAMPEVFPDTATGNVGIGTTNPGQKLDVSGPVHASDGFFDSTSANPGVATATGLFLRYEASLPINGPAIRWTNGSFFNTFGLFVNFGVHFQGDSINPDFFVDTPTTDGSRGTSVIKLGGGSTSATSWFNAGNVGIGTTTPQEKLEVNGIAKAKGHTCENNTPEAGIILNNTSSTPNQWVIFATGTGSTRGTRKFGIEDNTPIGIVDRLVIDSSGNVGLSTSSPLHPLHVGTDATNGNGAHVTAGGVWTNGSDRNSKKNFTAIDPRSILAKLAAMPITSWQYKGEADSVQHIGPVAQDFRVAFGLGHDERYITTIDADGVALAAIQGLHQIVQEKDCEIEMLQVENAEFKSEISSLKSEMEGLKRLVGALAAQKGDGQ